MADELHETATVLGGLVVATVLAVLLLLGSMGSGFIVAIIVMALLPLVFIGLAVDDFLTQRAQRRAAAAVPVPAPAPARREWSSVGRGVAAALLIAAFFAVVMSAVRGPAHVVADLATHAPYLALVVAGGGLLAAALGARSRGAVERWATLGSGLGVVIALAALMSCCLWALVYQLPVLSLLVLALVFNEVPVALVGLVLNALGLLLLARERGLAARVA